MHELGYVDFSVRTGGVRKPPASRTAASRVYTASMLAPGTTTTPVGIADDDIAGLDTHTGHCDWQADGAGPRPSCGVRGDAAGEHRKADFGDACRVARKPIGDRTPHAPEHMQRHRHRGSHFRKAERTPWR